MIWFSVAPTEAQGQARDTTLSDIPSQSFIIPGSREINFGFIERRKLDGFNPPPQSYRIPRGRRPYTSGYKQSTTEIPGTSLIQPVTPPATISVGQNPSRGEAFVGIGTYLSREIRGIASFDLSDDARAHFDVGHGGYDSFDPYKNGPRADVEAPFTNFQGEAGLEYGLGASTLGVDVDGFANKYNLYGLVGLDSSAAPPDRDGSGFGLSGAYTGGATTSLPFTVGGRIGSNTYKTDLTSYEIESKESQFDAFGDLTTKVGDNNLVIDGDLGRRSTDANDPRLAESGRSSVLGYNAGGDLELPFGGGTLRVGAQFQGYSTGDDHVPDSIDASKSFVAPRVEFSTLLGKGLEFYARNKPVARHTSQQSILDTNPFVTDGPMVLPELAVINTEGGLAYYAGAVRVSVRGGYASFNNHMVFDVDKIDKSELPD